MLKTPRPSILLYLFKEFEAKLAVAEPNKLALIGRLLFINWLLGKTVLKSNWCKNTAFRYSILLFFKYFQGYLKNIVKEGVNLFLVK